MPSAVSQIYEWLTELTTNIEGLFPLSSHDVLFLVVQAALKFDGFHVSKKGKLVDAPFIVDHHDLSITSSYPRLAVWSEDGAQPAACLDAVSVFSRVLIHLEPHYNVSAADSTAAVQEGPRHTSSRFELQLPNDIIPDASAFKRLLSAANVHSWYTRTHLNISSALGRSRPFEDLCAHLPLIGDQQISNVLSFLDPRSICHASEASVNMYHGSLKDEVWSANMNATTIGKAYINSAIASISIKTATPRAASGTTEAVAPARPPIPAPSGYLREVFRTAARLQADARRRDREERARQAIFVSQLAGFGTDFADSHGLRMPFGLPPSRSEFAMRMPFER